MIITNIGGGGTDTSDATLNSGAQMLKDVTAYSNDVKYTGTIETKTSSDLTASGATVTVPSGYYSTQATKAVDAGTLGTVTAVKGTVSNNSIEVTPQVAAGTAGYNAMAAYNGDAVTVSASELVSGTTNITTMNSTDVTNSQYAQVVDSNLTSANIITGKSILGVSGSAVVPSGSTTITTNTTTDVTNYASVVTNVPQAVPVEVSTDAGMTAVLTSENVGKAYKFVGTTGTYTNGDLYIVEDN